MRIFNELPRLLEVLRDWSELPSPDVFETRYLGPLRPLLQPMLSDFEGRFGRSLYELVQGVQWASYRDEALGLDPAKEEARLQRHIARVEKLLGQPLAGEAVLFGAFTAMDGYARFERGAHRVFLGVDESHGRGAYLDILVTHELTHVARESCASVWTGWGLDPKMSHDDFVDTMPLAEHLLNEGFACVVSHLLEPGHSPAHYAYQDDESIARILMHGPELDRVIHQMLEQGEPGNYGLLYSPENYAPALPRYCHYVWAWQWAEHVLKKFAKGDPKKLVGLCSKELVSDALAFSLPRQIA